ncbi:MAG: acyl-CoA carboxylase subunit beta [Planctomycetes bacterium]|nr:acyl-CoA carboxylase subunit beta [Planctomycetota bacterium]
MKYNFELLHKKALEGGGKEKIQKQHDLGKLTARERVDCLLDRNSFDEIDKFVVHNSSNFGLQKRKVLGDGVVTGFGKVNGRNIAVFSQDFTVFGGSLGYMHAQKICKIMDCALKSGVPVIGLNDSGGARIQEGVESLGGYAEIFLRNTLCSGVIPQISIILGPCAGGAVYSPAITDFTILVDGISYMFVTGPAVLKEVTHEQIDFEGLGGSRVHAEKSGVASFRVSSEQEAFELVRKLIEYIPQNNTQEPPFIPTTDIPERADKFLDSFIPGDPSKPYDMYIVLQTVFDKDSLLEVHQDYAKNILTCFGRLNGRSCGIVAQQPKYLAGCLDIDSSVKAARFVRFCDAFNIPVITFVDVPGFLPGVNQEHGGIIKHGAKLLYAYCEATIPKITIITRKAYGGAYDVMSSKHIRGDVNLAWPTAEIAVMGPEGAVNIIFKNLVRDKNSKMVKKLVQDYREKFSNPYIAAEKGYVDDIIKPSETRLRLIKALDFLKDKRDSNPPRKHGNIPL